MKKKILKICSVFLALACILSMNAFALQSTDITVAKNNLDFAIKSAKIIKKYDSASSKSQTNSVSELLRIAGRASDSSFDFKGLGTAACVVGSDGRFLLQFRSKNALKTCLEKLKSDPDILYAEQDAVIYTNAEETEEAAPLSWGTTQIGADEYSQYLSASASENSVTVAIVDSGAAEIDFLSGKLVSGYDFIENTEGGTKDTSVDSHGTFLASIVADCTKNANVSIMPVRVVDSKTASLVNAVNGIYYAVDNGADVINMSLGGKLSSCSSLDDAIAYAHENNVTVVVCSGNTKSSTDGYCPAHNESAITVSAVDESLNFSSDFSNYGAAVDMCAPGANINGYSASGTLKAMSGTSMSAAYVSAGAALFRLQHPECSPSQVQAAVKNVCTDLGDEGYDIYCGHGIPDFSKFIYDETVPDAPPSVVGISVKKAPDKTEYTYKSSEGIDLSGIELEAVYSDGTKQTVTDTSKITVSNFSTSDEGEHTVELEYAGCRTQLGITVSYAWWQWIIRILLLGFLWY